MQDREAILSDSFSMVTHEYYSVQQHWKFRIVTDCATTFEETGKVIYHSVIITCCSDTR